MIQLSKTEYDQWEEFRNVESGTIKPSEQKLIAQLHAKYFKHVYHIPCNCAPKQWNLWISEINKIYENGYTSNKQL